MDLSLISQSAQDTFNIGFKLGTALKQGVFISLCGELGAGKTCFTRGIVTAIAPESANLVASPSYSIINEYPGNPFVYHFDFYRLNNQNEIADLGFEEYFETDAICVAEWAERLGTLLPNEHIEIKFKHMGDDCRLITFNAKGISPKAILNEL